MEPSLAVHYLLEDTALFGGVKVALAQAELLSRRGHRVTVVSRSEAPEWFPLSADFVTRPDLDASDLEAPDVTVATFWTTLEAASRAAAAGRGVALHLCQGFEWLGRHNEAEHPAIRRAYRLAIPAMTISPHLRSTLGRDFGRPARLVPQPLEPAWRPDERQRPGAPPRLLVVGPFEVYLKGVPTALDAVKALRWAGIECRLIRLSQWPLAREERQRLEPDEFHHAVPPEEVPTLVRGCDLLLAPSWHQEGFGLPALEAMASGVPVVASDAPCYRAWAKSAARLVPGEDSAAFARAAAELLGDVEGWLRCRRAGLELAAGHTEEANVAAVDAALRWAVSGAWRTESTPAGPERPGTGASRAAGEVEAIETRPATECGSV